MFNWYKGFLVPVFLLLLSCDAENVANSYRSLTDLSDSIKNQNVNAV